MSFDMSYTPENPFELAAPRAMEAINTGFEMTDADEFTLAELDHGAELLGFHGQEYYVVSNLAFVIPASFDADSDIPVIKLGAGISFEGTFATFSKVHIGRFIGGSSVRAFCLSFSEALLLPYFDQVPDEDILHVPVLAIEDMSPSAV